MRIVFYGPEGCGKGTQAKLLGEKLNLPILASGDLVREAAANDKGLIGDACRKSLHEGKYVADSEMFVLWKKRLKQKDIINGWIIDGFPRDLEQAKFLCEKVDKYGYKIDKVFFLKINEQESMKRLIKRGRKLHEGNNELHDSPERIQQRLKMYQASEKDVINYFRNAGNLEEIDGDGSIEEVYRDILSRISQKE